MISKPSAQNLIINDPGNYFQNNLSGASLLQIGFKTLKGELNCKQLYGLPLEIWPNWCSTLYLVENKTRIRNYPVFWYTAFYISTNQAGNSRVVWRKETYSNINEINTLIRTLKNGKN
jgi:hypothetical protein